MTASLPLLTLLFVAGLVVKEHLTGRGVGKPVCPVMDWDEKGRDLVGMLGVAAKTLSYGIWVRAHLSSKGLGEHLPIGAEGALCVVLKQVLKLRMGTVFTQHHVAPIP